MHDSISILEQLESMLILVKIIVLIFGLGLYTHYHDNQTKVVAMATYMCTQPIILVRIGPVIFIILGE